MKDYPLSKEHPSPTFAPITEREMKNRMLVACLAMMAHVYADRVTIFSILGIFRPVSNFKCS